MAMHLATEELEFVIQFFCEQISFTIEKHEGFVFKYVSDAVIAIFVNDSEAASRSTIECGLDLLVTRRNPLNSELVKKGIPTISIKLGVDYGDALVVSFGNDEDLIGFSLSIASKITALGSPNIVLIGECLFEQVSHSGEFIKEICPSDYHCDDVEWN